MNRVIALVLLVVSLLFSSFKPVDTKSYGVRTVVIDAGHGGKDVGAVGRLTKEKDVTLAIALKLGNYIEANFADVKVIYTRKDDEFVELRERAAIANRNKADLFICIHCNSSGQNKTIMGAETYVMGLNKTDDNLNVSKRENSAVLLEDNYKQNYDGFDADSPEGNIIFSLYQNAYLEQSLKFAAKVQAQMRDKALRVDKGVKQAGFLVLYRTTMPSVLIETGFVSTLAEERFLISQKGQDDIASSIFNAFKEYKNELEKPATLKQGKVTGGSAVYSKPNYEPVRNEQNDNIPTTPQTPYLKKNSGLEMPNKPKSGVLGFIRRAPAVANEDYINVQNAEVFDPYTGTFKIVPNTPKPAVTAQSNTYTQPNAAPGTSGTVNRGQPKKEEPNVTQTGSTELTDITPPPQTGIEVKEIIPEMPKIGKPKEKVTVFPDQADKYKGLRFKDGTRPLTYEERQMLLKERHIRDSLEKTDKEKEARKLDRKQFEKYKHSRESDIQLRQEAAKRVQQDIARRAAEELEKSKKTADIDARKQLAAERAAIAEAKAAKKAEKERQQAVYDLQVQAEMERMKAAADMQLQSKTAADKAMLVYEARKKLENQENNNIQPFDNKDIQVPLKNYGPNAVAKKINTPNPVMTSSMRELNKGKKHVVMQLAPVRDDIAFYGVQILTSIHAIRADSAVFRNILPSVDNSTKGLYKYIVGEFYDLKEATNFQNTIVSNGFKDAFVVAFNKGKRILVKDAPNFISDGDKKAESMKPELPVIVLPKDISSSSAEVVKQQAALHPQIKTTVITDQKNVNIVNGKTDLKAAPNVKTAIEPPYDTFASQVGLVFSVQIAVSKTPLLHASDILKNAGTMKLSEEMDAGLYKYLVGRFKSFEDALKLQREMRNKGYKDAFIISHNSSQRVVPQENKK